MAGTSTPKEERLARARALLEHMEQDNDSEVERLLEELGRNRESNLFLELGKLTRDLHDALSNFRLDSRISQLAADDIPDARDRLGYVITLTEQAAHRTLNAVETALPLSEELERRSRELSEDWNRFRGRSMSADEFRALSRRIDEFLGWTAGSAAQIHSGLGDVLMAQDFQDLTGQMIRRVIALVHEVEENLVGLIRISGEQRRSGEPEPGPSQAPKLAGPQVPGRTDADVVGGQDDVDELLSSMGF